MERDGLPFLKFTKRMLKTWLSSKRWVKLHIVWKLPHDSGVCRYSHGPPRRLLSWALSRSQSPRPPSLTALLLEGSHWWERNLTPHPLGGIHFNYYGMMDGSGLRDGQEGGTWERDRNWHLCWKFIITLLLHRRKFRTNQKSYCS